MAAASSSVWNVSSGLPDFNVPHDYQSGSLDLVRSYALTGQNQKAQQLLDKLWQKSCQYLQWYCSLDGMRFSGSQHDCMLQIYIMQQMLDVQDLLSEELGDKKEQQLEVGAQRKASEGVAVDIPGVLNEAGESPSIQCVMGL